MARERYRYYTVEGLRKVMDKLRDETVSQAETSLSTAGKTLREAVAEARKRAAENASATLRELDNVKYYTVDSLRDTVNSMRSQGLLGAVDSTGKALDALNGIKASEITLINDLRSDAYNYLEDYHQGAGALAWDYMNDARKRINEIWNKSSYEIEEATEETEKNLDDAWQGFLDWFSDQTSNASQTLDNIKNEFLTQIQGLLGTVNDLTTPLVNGLANLGVALIDTLTSVFTVDIEEVLALQEQVQEAYLKKQLERIRALMGGK